MSPDPFCVACWPRPESVGHTVETHALLSERRPSRKPARSLTPDQRRAYRELVDDSGYSHAAARKIVLAGGL